LAIRLDGASDRRQRCFIFSLAHPDAVIDVEPMP
jgi:hypothetical protein